MTETTFNLYLPPSSTFGNSACPISLTLYSYNMPITILLRAIPAQHHRIDYYSSYSIYEFVTNLEGLGLDGELGVYSGSECMFNLFMDNNSIFNGSNGLYYETDIYNFYTGIPLGDYFTSGSTLGNMFPETLKDLSMTKIA